MTTFFAMVYILMVNANMFSDPLGDGSNPLGVSYGAIYIATAISAVIGTVLAGLSTVYRHECIARRGRYCRTTARQLFSSEPPHTETVIASPSSPSAIQSPFFSFSLLQSRSGGQFQAPAPSAHPRQPCWAKCGTSSLIPR